MCVALLDMLSKLMPSLLCTLHSTQLSPYTPRVPALLGVIAATLRQLLAYTEATTAIAFFAHTQLSLLYLIEIVDDLSHQNESKSLLQEIFSSAECILRIHASRMKLAHMLLLQVEGIKNRGCRSRTTSLDNSSTNSTNTKFPQKPTFEEESHKKRKWEDVEIIR